MSRIRTIKPSFFKDEDLAELEPLVRLLFIGLWGLADKEGRMEDRPKYIKVEVLPYDEIDINALLETLAAKTFILRYEIAGERYISIPGFTQHQRIGGKEADTESLIPPPPGEATGKQLGSNWEATGIAGREGKGREQEGKGKDKAEVPEDLADAREVILAWLAYKQERGQGYKPRGLVALWSRIRGIPAAGRRAAIEQSMANNYQGIFPAKGDYDAGKIKSGATPAAGKYAHLG